MKRLIILLFSIATAFTAVAAGDIETRDLKLFREDDKVVLSFSVYVPEKTVRSNRRLVVTPQLYNSNGAIDMDMFTITGAQMEKRNRQRRRLDKNSNAGSHINTPNSSTMRYTASIPYESWIEGTLFMRLQIAEEGCCALEDKGEILFAEAINLPLPTAPSTPDVVAIPSEVTQRTTEFPFLRLVSGNDQGERGASIRFKAASSSLDLAFSSNTENRNKIKDGVRLVSSNQRTNLEKITVIGFASPEGDNQQNIRLAEQRARALSRHLQKEMDLPESMFEIKSGGVDWDGLLDLVNQSDMRYKNEVMDIIKNTPVENRNEKLKQLAGGRPYQSIYDVLFPQLRDACYISVWYSEAMDEAAQVINGAIELVNNTRYEEALRNLQTVENDSRSWNVTGTIYLLQGDYQNARIWLEKAVEAGDKEAEKNLNLIN